MKTTTTGRAAVCCVLGAVLLAARNGPLAIGHFNDTMQGDGLGRQFRGEIGALEIYGNRVGARGAMDARNLKP